MQALQLRPDSTQAQANLALYLELTNQQEQAAAMMDANRMSTAARSAVREAAQRLRDGAAAPRALVAPAGTSARDETLPLALKTSRRSHLTEIRTAIPANPEAIASSPPPIPTSRGTP
ncbi:hypothetical protein D3C71_1565020 [compost metagenome]